MLTTLMRFSEVCVAWAITSFWEEFSIARLDPHNIITMSVYPPDIIVSKVLEKHEQKVTMQDMQDMQIEDQL